MSEYSFEKKSIITLIISMIVLLILVYFLGLLTGMGMDRPEQNSSTQLTASAPTEEQAQESESIEVANTSTKKSALSYETEPKPVTPDFKSVSPKAEQPGISQPKKE